MESLDSRRERLVQRTLEMRRIFENGARTVRVLVDDYIILLRIDFKWTSLEILIGSLTSSTTRPQCSVRPRTFVDRLLIDRNNKIKIYSPINREVLSIAHVTASKQFLRSDRRRSLDSPTASRLFEKSNKRSYVFRIKYRVLPWNDSGKER